MGRVWERWHLLIMILSVAGLSISVVHKDGFFFDCVFYHGASGAGWIQVGKARRLQGIGRVPMVTVHDPSRDSMQYKEALNPASWMKTGPVFSKVPKAHSPRHASFSKSPDGQQDWIVYHAKGVAGASMEKRRLRMQLFAWYGNAEVFGTPTAFGTCLPEPSGPIGVERYEAE